MAIAVNDLVDKAEIILQDTTNVRWSTTELIGWLNDGQREIVLHKPDACVTTSSMQLTSGTKQSLPAGGLMLIDGIRNMGTDGTTAGDAIRLINREILDAQVPDWHSETAVTSVKHYIFDDRNPKTFYVYPQSTGTNYLEIVYSTVPTVVAAGDNITIDDIYNNVLLDYMLYRAYQKDADYAVNDERTKGYYQVFATAVGILNQAENSIDPNNRK